MARVRRSSFLISRLFGPCARSRQLSPLRLVLTCALVLGAMGGTTFPAQQPRTAGTAGTAGTVGSIAPRATPVPSAVQASVAQGYAAQQHTQKAQDLINRARASYQSGVDNYNNNRLDQARADFDAAVDLMLSSGMDLKNDPQVADDFEELLNQINALEVLALRQGNGFSPKIEDAPLEAATDLTFAPNPELVAKLTSELSTASDLPLVINDQVAGYIGVFSASNNFRAHMSASMQRLGRYRTMIQNVLKDEGVPQDLIYLAVAESGFQPQAVNYRSGAGGMWQFMTFTAPEYGLTRNGYFDYRFDPEKSSHAYARYMKKLYALFGDWYLAMAAYDWGPGNIQRVVSRSGYADFWELYRRNMLPGETRAYVPKILAAVIMAKNPERYGLNKLPPSPPVIYDTVTVDNAVSLPLAADLTNSSVPELVALNPALLRLSTPRDIPYDLHLPPGTKDIFLTRLKDIPEEDRNIWRFHVVRQGETLDGIAASFHMPTATIASYNEISSTQPMDAGDELIVPVATAAGVAPGQQRYVVHRGDTLVTVADRFGVTIEQLREWNGSNSAHLKPGRTIYVAQRLRLAPGARSAHGSRAPGKSRNHARGGAQGPLRRSALPSRASSSRALPRGQKRRR